YYLGAQEVYDSYQQIVATRSKIADLLAAKPKEPVSKALEDFDAKLTKLKGIIRRGRRFFGPPPTNNLVNLNGFLLVEL
ncbi:hypothetical protein ACJENY_24850, partial [Escherichia coli]